MSSTARSILAATLALAAAGPAMAACYTITFEELAVGTAVTTQYWGVTFSFQVSGCPAGQVRIANPPGGASSGTRALQTDDGPAPCEFNPGWIRMVFTHLQREVTFTLGPSCATYDIRAYNAAGALLEVQSITIPDCTRWHGTHRLVRVSRAAAEIRRIEIEHTNNMSEAIDDLSFDIDPTPPVAEITSPAQLACICNGTTIIGSAYDPDGPILNWKLERKALGATTWTLIANRTEEVINGALATWTTAAADGYYTLRLTVTNACDLETVWTTDVWLDKAFNSLLLRSPGEGGVYGGTLCADGTAWDHCGGSIVLEYRPSPAGAWRPFDSVSPPWIITDTLGSWNTRAVPDGAYDVRLRPVDDCSNTSSAQVTISVDNTIPTTVITSPRPCAHVEGVVDVMGTVNDAHLAGWVLEYSGGDVHGWVTISASNKPVVNGLLGTWNTKGLRTCAYILRLRAWDSAILDCSGDRHNESEYLVAVDVGGLGNCFDTDADGDVDVNDFAVFQLCFNGPGRPPACD